MNKRQEVRRVTMEDCMERSLALLSEREGQLEGIIGRDIVDRNLEALENDESAKWIPWKNELSQTAVLVQNSGTHWHSAFDELAQKVAIFDARIARFKRSLGKSKRNEQRILARLASFAKWLDLAEEDADRAEAWHDKEEKVVRYAFSGKF
ncbi:unnamed protein product [Gongylonema pulchrum]|uniref:FF domain-containing protein n=1 Tax=Gongylonema pulchrum TaxID=637853 RepID=A0A183DGH2_9BILA|nr:unnamed protein product [Gongylonema pulchrum]